MPLRLMEIYLPETNDDAISEFIDDESIVKFWQERSAETGLLVKMILSVEQTEKMLDKLEQRFGGKDGFRGVLLPIEATIPRIKGNSIEEEPAPDKSTKPDYGENEILRISREDLYSDIVDSAKFTITYAALVLLSAIVAAVGLLQDNVAIVIGAMVIAPLLGPNVALALATTLGDFDLGFNALKTNLLGISIALGLSITIGYFFPVDPAIPEIASRMHVELPDIVLALASGSAGVLAFTSGASISLIGVMVAVALMPPLITFGLLIGSGNVTGATGALLLLITNLICVNLAGVTTFLVQGIRPRKWWEAAKAKRAARLAITLWSVLLAVLIVVIIFSQKS
ncbi:MAG: TIGR00341 family protein [Anaerolineae bacterium]|nr:TIGR00341 family protein [Anaerolineae bacterium]